MSELAYLGLGANLGDPLETLTAAVFALDELDGLAVQDVSGVYRTPPWPSPPDPRAVDQPDYLDLVVRAVTTLDPHALLAETRLLETAFGRDRTTEVRWGPRVLDIDLLLVGSREIDTPDLTLPHPRIADRAFVLVPLLEVAPGGALPDGRRFTELLNRLAPVEGVELYVRLDQVPGRHVPRPEGPSAPPASFHRPGRDPTAAEHGRPDATGLDGTGRRPGGPGGGR